MGKRFFQYLSKHKAILLTAVFFMLINAVVTLAPAEWGGRVLKQLLQQKAVSKLLIFALIALAIFTVKLITDFMRRFLMGYLGNLICVDMQRDFHAKLLKLPLSFFKKQQSGEILSRATNDIALIREFFGSHLISFIGDPLLLIFGITRLFILNWLFSLELIAAGVIIGLVIHWVGNLLRRIIGKLQASLGDMTATIQESLYAINIIKIFSRERYHKNKFQIAADDHIKHAKASVKLKSLFRPIVDFIGFLGVLAIITTGAILIANDTMKIDQLFTFIFYIGILSSPLNAITGFYMQYKTSEAAAERFFEIIDQMEEKDQGTKELTKIKGEVSFKKVSFQYQPEKPILSKISFQAKPGQTIAIVGRSGSGKTTLVNLLPRLINPAQGSILIDNQKIENITLLSLRSQISMVTQENILLPGTILENIKYGELDASEEEVIVAAKAAHAHHFIQKLPKQYNTLVSEYGANLSGGQKQRIAIARAILKKPAILILDEATSALDSESEKMVQKAVAGLMHKQTTFIIAHRLSTVKKADTIIVLEKGTIIESGTHQELYNQKKSLYRTLYKHQFQD